MINVNGNLSADTAVLAYNNRSFLYGDGCFESIRTNGGKPCFVEDHYFRLMASVRMMRMDVPMHFTLEFFESELQKTLDANPGSNFLRFVMYRKEGGLYSPESNEVCFIINSDFRSFVTKERFEIGVYKDFYINESFLSSIKSTQKVPYVLASIFAKENHYNACLMMNPNKMVVSSNLGNIYIVKGKEIITAPFTSGALNGVIRKKLKELISNNEDYSFVERDFNPFELQKADEVFITNCSLLIQPVTNYKKKEYATEVSSFWRKELISLISDH